MALQAGTQSSPVQLLLEKMSKPEKADLVLSTLHGALQFQPCRVVRCGLLLRSALH